MTEEETGKSTEIQIDEIIDPEFEVIDYADRPSFNTVVDGALKPNWEAWKAWYGVAVEGAKDPSVKAWWEGLKYLEETKQWRENGFTGAADFVKKTFNYNVTLGQVRRLIAAEKVKESVSDGERRVPKESAARALGEVPEEKREEALDLAEKLAKEEGRKKPTAKQITTAAAVVTKAKLNTGPMKPEIQQILVDAKEIREIQGDIQKIRQRITEASEKAIGQYLPANTIDTSLKNAWESLKLEPPSGPCVYCEQGYVEGAEKPDGCKACKNTGWISVFLWQTAPKGLRK